MLASPVILKYRDPHAPYILYTDALDIGLDACSSRKTMPRMNVQSVSCRENSKELR
jgi:hypothetical protein